MKNLNYNSVIAKTLISYAVFSGLWILFSDKILAAMLLSQDTKTDISIYKGWAFVLVTTVLLALKLSGELRKKRMAEEKALEMELAKAKAEQADRLKSAFLPQCRMNLEPR